MMRRLRIGIDVGGTFTDAALIDGDTLEIVATEKIPTTHSDSDGVAAGIIKILREILKKADANADEVTFIAHGTTQATNALLEGDTALVGTVALASSLLAAKAKEDTFLGDIELAPKKFLRVKSALVETENAESDKEKIIAAIRALKADGAEVIAASEPFSVDDDTGEKTVTELAESEGLPATSGSEVSKLYGLRVRTRTAVLNASLLPKMLETANLTEKCVKSSGIKAPLMIMRCDGGVMTIDEVRRRPMLTLLSGLAAGVAGALMYEKISGGIFLEAGGTSTDISAIKNGKVMLKGGEVGGHKTHLTSLDVRTLGVAGGSLIRLEKGKIADVGPRSAHIAGLAYEAFSPSFEGGKLVLVAPLMGDEEAYAAIEKDGKKIALTLAGAANALGCVPEGDYALGDKESALTAWRILGDTIGLTGEEAARAALDKAAEKIGKIVRELMRDYALDEKLTVLAGGGGSAGVVVPYLAEKMNMSHKIVKNAPIISTIGVALAMVRESVERTVANPTDDDIKKIRAEAKEKIMRAGAAEGAIEITVEIDQRSNLLRAVALGATELREKNAFAKEITESEKESIAKRELSAETVKKIAAAGAWSVYEAKRDYRRFKIFPAREFRLCVIDREGVVRLKTLGGGVLSASVGEYEKELFDFLAEHTEYGTIGGALPQITAYVGERQIDLTGLSKPAQVASVLQTELDGTDKAQKLIIIAGKSG